MKKRLEADLVSIAHRILQLKNKSDVNQLFWKPKKLSVRFVNEHYGTTKPTITHAEIERKSKTFMIKVLTCLLQP
jgi:hypothetical protein